MSTGTRDYIMTLEETTGNVGIGTTSPAAILHLAKDNAVLRIEATTNGQNCSTWYRANGNNQWETGCNIGAGTDYQIYDRLNGASRMVVGHNGNVTIPGNVGIGVTAPLNTLHVAGSVRATSGVYFNSTSTTGFKIENDSGNNELDIYGGSLVPGITIDNSGLLKFGAFMDWQVAEHLLSF